MRIYIRHADKEYKNGNSEVYKHDPGITNESMMFCQLKCDEMIIKYGIPLAIVCSPYKRTRETAIYMAQHLKMRYKIDVLLKYDIRLSEYLGNQKSDDIDVTEETKKYNPPHPESFHQMDSRVRWHNDMFRDLDFQNEIVWFITHGLIINRISNSMGFKLPHRIPCLTSVSFSSTILNTEELTICEIGSGNVYMTVV